MSRLQIFNAVLLAAGASLALVLSVVCVIYLFYITGVPRLRAELGTLIGLSAVFWTLAGASGLAFIAQRQQYRWRWLVQPLPLLPLAGVALYVWLGSRA